MRRLLFRFLSVAVVLAAGAARAQPCCAGTNLLTPGRLALHEDELVAVQVRASDLVGSFAPSRTFVPGGASEVDFEQDLVGTVRFLTRGQLSAMVPFVESARTSASGGGVGDVAVSARWDFINAGEGTPRMPGVAVVLGLTAPTGSAPESALIPTGTGAWQGGMGLAFEENWRHAFVTATTLLTQRAPRSVGGLTETLGFQFSGGLALGWAFDSGPAAAFTVTYLSARDAVIDGQPQTGSATAQTLVGLGVAKPLWEDWRLQGSLFSQLPIEGLGRNEPSSIGLSVLLIRGWM